MYEARHNLFIRGKFWNRQNESMVLEIKTVLSWRVGMGLARKLHKRNSGGDRNALYLDKGVRYFCHK